jgi:hypothetical protein
LIYDRDVSKKLDTKEKFDEFFTNNTPLLKKEEYFDFI